MKLSEIMVILQEIAPVELAEDWDNVGLLAGDPEQTIKKIMLTIDLTAEVMAEAKKFKADLLLAYHPPIWDAIKKVVRGMGASPLVYEAIRNNMAIYAMHTALDVARGGVNDLLAEIVGIANPESLQKPEVQTGAMCKLVVFLPEGDLEKVSEAIFAVGAGDIGEKAKYSKCSFRCKGTGTFQGERDSNPTVGKARRFEQAPELRLETIAPREKIGAIVRAMVAAHSYEEVAYDVIPLYDGSNELGLGRWGDLAEPIAAGELIEKIKKRLKVKTVGIIGPAWRKVRRGAVCAGSCGSLLRNVIRQKCDFYLTGELKHHHALELQQAGVTAVCVSHTVSERIILPRIATKLRRQCPRVEIKISGKDRDPFLWS
ncbi:MAG: Nif3-like dinuclear metal center hexameric protein [Sedimentisphaerales bacterium]|nr:Nif3-like dinuclear metal center hexameric protein [Sedimentisphaerales bacterium]